MGTFDKEEVVVEEEEEEEIKNCSKIELKIFSKVELHNNFRGKAFLAATCSYVTTFPSVSLLHRNVPKIKAGTVPVNSIILFL